MTLFSYEDGEVNCKTVESVELEDSESDKEPFLLTFTRNKEVKNSLGFTRADAEKLRDLLDDALKEVTTAVFVNNRKR